MASTTDVTKSFTITTTNKIKMNTTAITPGS